MWLIPQLMGPLHGMCRNWLPVICSHISEITFKCQTIWPRVFYGLHATSPMTPYHSVFAPWLLIVALRPVLKIQRLAWQPCVECLTWLTTGNTPGINRVVLSHSISSPGANSIMGTMWLILMAELFTCYLSIGTEYGKTASKLLK